MRVSFGAGILGNLLFLFVLLSAVRIGTSELLIWRVESALVPPSADGTETLAKATQLLDAAAWFSPASPVLFGERARVAWWQAQWEARGEDRQVRLRAALNDIREAIALRPVSPYDWAMELRLKQALAEYDDEFRRALRMTAELGPWEPLLQTVVVDAGYAGWSSLSETDQAVVMGAWLRGMKRQAPTMRAIAAKYAPRNGGGGPAQ